MSRNVVLAIVAVAVVIIAILGASGALSGLPFWPFLNEFAFWTAIQYGLVYGFVALGVYLSFRILDFPDLTVDGSLPLGAAVAGSLILLGVNPWIATLAALGSGAAAGLVTATLSVRFRILHLLASILTMSALYSINVRVMGQSNISIRGKETILTPFYDLGLTAPQTRVAFLAVLLLIVAAALGWFLTSSAGLGMRAAGANARMARAQGIRTGGSVYLGMAMSNGLVALGGAMFVQTQLFADVTSGQGTIVVGLASVIVGEAILKARGIWLALFGCVLGSILYRLAVQWALAQDQVCMGFCVDFLPSDLNLIAALTIAIALIIALRKGGWAR